ncbi:hypothetical protein ACQW02_15410 [Humitalea sp. 24SJ18S-53]|uniref:hypothetical protein n=1 Tax=Humitalea sp. 24SJ18S-53 TaxID=3422307 RepID=UPI003D667A7E
MMARIAPLFVLALLAACTQPIAGAPGEDEALVSAAQTPPEDADAPPDPPLRTATLTAAPDVVAPAPRPFGDAAPAVVPASLRGTGATPPGLVLTPLAADVWSSAATAIQPREPAPMPNRGLDPPFSLPSSDPSFSPTLMRPGTGPDPSAALGPGHPQFRDDRQFQQPAAGARLRLPFTN